MPENSLWGEVFSHPDLKGGLLIMGKTVIIYLFLVLGLRLLGKRELGQMNIYDVVLVIVLANAVQNSMVGDDNSLVGGVIAATTLLILNRLFNLIMSRSKRIERLMIGNPILIVNHGKAIQDNMVREGITREQLHAALREHGLHSEDQARMCVLEVDGTISVVPQNSNTFRTRHHYKGLRLP